MNNQYRSSSRENNKMVIFKTIAILLPLLIILLLEAGLRLFGYGHDLRLFVDDEKNKGYWVMNPHASKRYFAEEENATIGTFESFQKHKTPETFRIFVLGESTTIGYPYMYNASFHRWLFYRLMLTFPDKQFEIINLSLTAVNSYTVLGFAKEMVNYQPDAVLIYCGQNEFYGTLGVGSTSRFGSNRFLIQSVIYLRSFRVVQLVGNGVSKIRSIFTGKQINTRETLMKRMALRQEIPYNSVTFNQGVKQFQLNLNAVCQLLSKKHIPVFISNLVSNEKDLKPFVSSKAEKGVSADYLYTEAENAYEKGNFAKAKQQYILAKDLDMLRFRAPDTLNKIIECLPKEFPEIHIVDAIKVFEEHSPHGIIGEETILEHVHPNILGYSLLADAFYQTMKQNKLISATWKNEISLEKLQHDMPITKVDSLKGTFEIMVLKENWPFNQKKNFNSRSLNSFEEKMAAALLDRSITWNEAMPQLMNYYLKQNDFNNASRVAESVALQYPIDTTFLNYAGKFCMNLHQNKRAEMYYLQLFRLNPSFETAKNLAILFLKDDEPENAITFLNFLSQNNSTKVNFTQALNIVKEVIALKDGLQNDADNITLLNQIALDYYKMQNVGIAQIYAEKAIRINPGNSTAIALIHQIRDLSTNIH